MREIYLDNSATTRAADEVAEAVADMLVNCYGNPSSLHQKGLDAENRIELARGELARLLGCESGSLVFTSGGTEANNLAILGAAEAHRRRGSHIVITGCEHSSVEEAAAKLEDTGYSVTRVAPDEKGHISADDVAAAVGDETILVSCMLVNNEVGAVLPVERIARLVRQKNQHAIVHCDCVQALGKIPISLSRLGVDLATVSAHKIYGPKGVGALYIRRGARILPRQHGGGQEKGLRPGTEAAALIAGFGVAARLAGRFFQQDESNAKEFNRLLRGELSQMPQVVINSPEDAVPSIVNISVPGYRSETLLNFLSRRGISVSSGSACAKGAKSRVLTAMGLSPRIIDSALRISFGRYNRPQDAAEFCTALREAIATLAHTGA